MWRESLFRDMNRGRQLTKRALLLKAFSRGVVLHDNMHPPRGGSRICTYALDSSLDSCY